MLLNHTVTNPAGSMIVAPEPTCPRCRSSHTVATATGSRRCTSCGTVFDPRQEVTPTATDAIPRSPLTDDLAPGQRLGSYVLGERLGEGGMGTVWTAQQESLRRPVAIKILHAHLSTDQELRRRFLREAEALVQLDHPRIVAVLDSGEHASRPYLVTALVGRRTLREELNEHRRLPPTRVRTLGFALCEALTHAHDRGLIHRDVKPENIILDDAGEPRLADFGIAQVAQGLDGHTLTHLTKTGMVLGTVAYMAPEQGDGGPVDARTDLYALGVVLYEALVGHRPSGRFEDPGENLTGASTAERQAWNEALLPLLHRDPARRPGDAAAAARLLWRTSRAGMEPAREVSPTNRAATGSPRREMPLQRELPPRATNPSPAAPRYDHGRRFYRDPRDAWLGGLCGGLGKWSGIGSGWVRVAGILGAVTLTLPTLAAYIVGTFAARSCPDPHYRPRAWNRHLPHRPTGWFLGVCAALGESTGAHAWLWRILAVVLLPLAWVPYLVLAILLPSLTPEERAARAETTRRLRLQREAEQARAALDGRNLRHWLLCCLGLAVTWGFFHATPTPSSPALQTPLLILAMLTAAAGLGACFNPSDRPRSGGFGGLISGAGGAALMSASILACDGAVGISSGLLAMATWAAALFLLGALWRRRDAALGLTLSAACGAGAVLWLGARWQGFLAIQSDLPMALASDGRTWLGLANSLPRLVGEAWDGSFTQPLLPEQALLLGAVTWALAALALARPLRWLTGPESNEHRLALWLPGLALTLGLVLIGIALRPQPMPPTGTVAGGAQLLESATAPASPGSWMWIGAGCLVFLTAWGFLARLHSWLVTPAGQGTPDDRSAHRGRWQAVGVAGLGFLLLAGWLLTPSLIERPRVSTSTGFVSDSHPGDRTDPRRIHILGPNNVSWVAPFGALRIDLGKHGELQPSYTSGPEGRAITGWNLRTPSMHFSTSGPGFAHNGWLVQVIDAPTPGTDEARPAVEAEAVPAP